MVEEQDDTAFSGVADTKSPPKEGLQDEKGEPCLERSFQILIRNRVFRAKTAIIAANGVSEQHSVRVNSSVDV